MIQTGFESRIKVQQIIENQLPEFILDENPKTSEFLKQYYISQEYQGGPIDISENLDQYLKLDNLVPEVIVGSVGLTTNISSSAGIVTVTSTKGFPNKYGLLKIDDEIITYTGITTNSFTGCIRGFSGITNYHQDLNYEELVFSTSESAAHNKNSTVTNLSALFLQEFYKKLKYTLTPGLEDLNFVSDLNVGNFIKEAKTFYQAKGTPESFRILFNVLFGENPKIIDLEKYLIKSSDAEYIRRETIVAERISGDPGLLVGQTIKKLNDEKTTASVSEVEIITRNGKTYYKLLIFIGYDESFPTITGDFRITPTSKCIDYVPVGSTVITVDSTVGFPESGTIYSGDNEINYTSKSINQFFGCYSKGSNSISIEIRKTTPIRSDYIYYGYENGDITKPVKIRVTGVLSNLAIDSAEYNLGENNNVFVKNIGEIIKNPPKNKTYKELSANSWIYNTSSRYQLDFFTESTVTTKSEIYDSSLRIGDYIEFLERNSEIVVPTLSNVKIISISNKTISVDTNLSTLNSLRKYDIRRKLKKASSSIVPIGIGTINLEGKVFSDVQNVYSEKDDYLYVASNSLPSYQITTKTFNYQVKNINAGSYNGNTKKYSILEFENEISFLTGDEVYYEFSDTPINGLDQTNYYVELLPNKKQIRLYISRNFINTSQYIEFGDETGILPNGNHNFILYSQKSNLISPQKLLRKFNLNPIIGDVDGDKTLPGSVGMLLNGVEIFNYKSNDKIYYGPIDSVEVFNSGNDYDIINPPSVTFDSGSALIQPVIQGSVKKIHTDLQEFDIDVNIIVSLTGGNGSDAIFNPIIEKRRREISFDAREISVGGGLDVNSERITFLNNHSLVTGQKIIYDTSGNSQIGIGSFGGLNTNQNKTLVNGSEYYAKVLNDKTIQLFQNFADSIAGVNTVGFTTVGNSGIQKFKTEPKYTLSEIKIIDGGRGYTNRKLIVKPTGISTYTDTINFKNHGFLDGEVINYTYRNSNIVGLSSANSYYVLKIDNDSFRLCDAGIGATIRSNYTRKKYVNFSSTGSGYQIFNYPEINLSVKYSSIGIGSTQILGVINATPVLKGGITDLYVYENGADYGSKVLNYQKKPNIKIKTGFGAQLKPVISSNGELLEVLVLYGGQDYYSIPDIEIIGKGSGAEVRCIIFNRKISKVIVTSSGINYDSNTKLIVKSSGKNAVFNPIIRSLTVNNSYRYGVQNTFYRDPANELLVNSNNNLKYTISGYSEFLKTQFNDPNTNTGHSPIIGWAYDGNPIYGPYGYKIPDDINSTISVMNSGYSQISVENRPSEFDQGFFVEDFIFDNSGDLDEYNGRFCKTPEFPNGRYVYFSSTSINPSGDIVGRFPYFIGDKYKSKFISDNLLLNQSFEFNNSKLIRNTLPYKVNDQYAGNDFIIESNEIINQRTIIESVKPGSVSSFDIIDSGTNYKVNDILSFDETQSKGYGVQASVFEIDGKNIVNINTTSKKYQNALIIRENAEKIKVVIDPYHDFVSGDTISISGISTNLFLLNDFYKIGFTTYRSFLTKDIQNVSSTGIVTSIVLDKLPENISIGNTIKIENEILKVLDIYDTPKALKVLRGSPGVAHTQTTPIQFYPNSFYITHNKKIDSFDSQNNSIVFFNPRFAIGVGTTSGYGIDRTYYIDNVSYQTFIPTQSIFIPNHPFKTNQKVILRRPNGTTGFSVANTPTSGAFGILVSSTSETLYVINKSKDHIGIVTAVGLTTNTSGLFFPTPTGSNNEFYTIETVNNQVTANIKKIESKILTTIPHDLQNEDSIILDVKSNISTGIGTLPNITVKYNNLFDKILVNPTIFNYSGINTITNTIQINSHGFNTGDVVFYDAEDLVATGLSTGKYFICKVDDDNIKLSETYYDCILNDPKVVEIYDVGGNSQQLCLINPPLTVFKNNDLVFDVSDSSLYGYNFKIYFDENFNNEFISVGTTSTFSVLGVGTIGQPGIGTTSIQTLKFSSDLPEKLFYTFEKSGSIIEPDRDVKDFSKITFNDSIYSGKYNVYGVGNTSFSISLKQVPESLYYDQSLCDILKYSTTSATAKGGINKIQIISNGSDYKELPIYNGTNSSTGEGAFIIPKSNTIGKLNQTRIVNEGFEYSSDKTLRPSALIPELISITSANTIKSVEVISGGKKYTSAPSLVIVDSTTGKKINSGLLSANMNGLAVSSVSIESKPVGLPYRKVKIKAINNSNGIKIDIVQSSISGIVTCILNTPIAGFGTNPFSIGDDVFVEGIENYVEGLGFNSQNHGYQFFKVINYYTASNPGRLEFKIPELYGDPGIAKTIQTSYAILVKSTDYPVFSVEQEFSNFFIGEKLLSDIGYGFVERDLTIENSNPNYIRVIGNYELSPNEIIKGVSSFNVATVNSIQNISGKFDISYSKVQRIGWKDDTGKINEDSQAIQDNDYYQNLSYAIKSTRQWEEIVTPVNSLVHTSGLKNFANTEITKNVKSGLVTATEPYISIIKDFTLENRVDTINNLDLVVDVDSFPTITKTVKFKNLKIADYIECRTNRVLEIDDISPYFSSVEDERKKTNVIILPLDITKRLNRALIQIVKSDYSEIQLEEIVVINNGKSAYTLQKGLLSNKDGPIGAVSGIIDENNSFYLQFDPVEPYNSDYDIKILNSQFNTPLTGISTYSVGFTRLIASNKVVKTGVTTSVMNLGVSSCSALYTGIEVIDVASNRMDYTEFCITHDGTNTYMSNFYFDDSNANVGNYIGTFTSQISNGIISLNFTNTLPNDVRISSKTVGFGSTSIGIGTYRFKFSGQKEGTELTALYDSRYTRTTSNSTILSLDKNSFSSVKSLVKVGYGKTTSLHQILMVHDTNDVYVTQYPFLSVGITSGIGTFGGSISGNNFILSFYPDSVTNNANLEILTFSECFYKLLDEVNIPPSLYYSPITESFTIAKYYGLNSNRLNRSSFDLNYKDTPIFSKTFDPSDATILNPITGLFTINNHFFSNAEELIYTPKSTFIGVGTASVGIGTTANYLGISTNVLPSKVYAIKISNSQFKLSTRKDYALAGIYVTFTSLGQGNAHNLEMYKKNEKSFITINNLAQYPISFTPNYQSLNNGRSIGIGDSIFALSGISTVTITDILKIDDEYMKVTNVGFGTTNVGPIIFSGSVPLVQVERGFVGTAASNHSDNSIARIYKGSYNIVGSKIFFTDPPRGNIFDLIGYDQSNLQRERARFNGRVFLRKDYSTNTIYDNISDQFTGIGQTYTLTVLGVNTVGLGTTAGNGLVFINNIFQTPTTLNATISNYSIVEDTSVGITSVVFSGITSSNGSIVISEADKNQNKLPRGGLIVSLGSTPGLGYAPLVGASVTAIVGAGGSIIGFGQTGNYGSGYRLPVSIAITESNHSGGIATITASVGAGGSLSFNIIGGGSGYTNPMVIIPSPSYENLPVKGVTRLGIGNTTETGTGLLVNLDIGPARRTGIGSTLFEVSSFRISRSGYNFKIGDVFTPVGLVTAKGLTSPIEQFKLTVLEVFNDSFGAIQFGEMNYIDSIKQFQDGKRVRFPLYYNAQLLSFESNRDDPDSSLIDFDSILMIFINGIIQVPKVAYNFSGGTTFTFTTAPKAEDNVSIFFYVGTRDLDSVKINVTETIKEGDDIQIFSNNNNLLDTITQDSRTVNFISGSDRIETDIYTKQGIDDIHYKPLYWTKQKRDLIINNTIVSKARDSIESQIYPTSKIIKNFSSTDTELFVDNAAFFNYENGSPTSKFDCLIVDNGIDNVAAAVTAVVSVAGTISSLSIVNPGSGYSGSSITVKISRPHLIGVGVGTTATATISVSGGILVQPITITNPGSGYTSTNPPQVIIPSPSPKLETIKAISIVQGFDGVITGIATTSGVNGARLALKFTIFRDSQIYTDLQIGYPIYINNTRVGNGVTSIYTNNSDIVGIGTTCLDNIYIISGIDKTLGIITCNISSNTSIVGIATTGTVNYPVGRFSWGRLQGFTRSSSPISIAVTGKTLDVGLTTFATVQRRGYGLRNIGAIKKQVNAI